MQHLGGVASPLENYQCPKLGYARLKVTFPRAPITLASFAEKTHDASNLFMARTSKTRPFI